MIGSEIEAACQLCVLVKVFQVLVSPTAALADVHLWFQQMEGVLQLGEQLLERQLGVELVVQDSTRAALQLGRVHRALRLHTEEVV